MNDINFMRNLKVQISKSNSIWSRGASKGTPTPTALGGVGGEVLHCCEYVIVWWTIVVILQAMWKAIQARETACTYEVLQGNESIGKGK